MPAYSRFHGNNRLTVNQIPPSGCYFEVTFFPGYLNPVKLAKVSFNQFENKGGKVVAAIVGGILAGGLAGAAGLATGLQSDNDDLSIESASIRGGVLAGSGYSANPLDFRFNKVSGISFNIDAKDVKEGGNNTQVLKLPNRVTHGNLILKRGLFFGSPLTIEFTVAMTLFQMIPGDVMVTLCSPDNDVLFPNDKAEVPIAAWLFRNAYPVSWKNDDLWADNNNVSLETMELSYSHMIPIRL